jgi:hypothetical protein
LACVSILVATAALAATTAAFVVGIGGRATIATRIGRIAGRRGSLSACAASPICRISATDSRTGIGVASEGCLIPSR